MTTKNEPDVSIRILNPTSGMIMSLTEPQRKLLDRIGEGRNLTGGRLITSARAMIRNGWLVEGNPGTFTLTAAGRALIEEQALLKQTPADFTVGERVEYLNWRADGSGCWTHYWLPATVKRLTKMFVTLTFDDGYEQKHKGTTIRHLPPDPALKAALDADFRDEVAFGNVTHESLDNVIAEQRAAFAPTLTATEKLIADYHLTVTDPYLAVRVGNVVNLLASMPKRWKGNPVLWEAYRALRDIRNDAQYAAFAQVTENSEREALKGRARHLPTEVEFAEALAKAARA